MSGPGDVPSIQQLDFVAEVSIGEPVQLRLAGSADSGTSAPFADLIARIHDLMDQRDVRLVVVDMLALEFMSASAFNSLVGWLSLINELPPERRYQLRFRSNPEIVWQGRSLRTLSCFATDLVTIESNAIES